MFAVHKTLHTQGPGQRELCRNLPKASSNPALLDLSKGICDLQEHVHVAPRDLCKCRAAKGPVQECRTRPRPQGTPRWWTCIMGLKTRKDLSMFAARKTLHTQGPPKASKDPAMPDLYITRPCSLCTRQVLFTGRTSLIFGAKSLILGPRSLI